LTVAGPPARTSNWAVSVNGELSSGNGERLLIDHRGGVVRDFLVGSTWVQLVEDDFRSAELSADGSGDYMAVDFGNAQFKFRAPTG
jgi:hypothetical protein